MESVFHYGRHGASLPKAPDADARPDLFTAFQEQLGLRSKRRRRRRRCSWSTARKSPL